MEDNVQVQEAQADSAELQDESLTEENENSESASFQSIPDYSEQLELIMVEVQTTSAYLQDVHKNIELFNYQLFFISLLLIILVLRGKRK